MMSNYEFKETGSRNIERDGEQVRLVSFRGNSPIEGDDRERLNIDGAIVVQITDYFQAGIDGAIPELIKNKVVERLTARETENAE